MDVGNLTYRSFRPLLERAGLPKIRVHDLCHTFATLTETKDTACKRAHEHLVEAGRVQLLQVQADEIRVKAVGGVY